MNYDINNIINKFGAIHTNHNCAFCYDLGDSIRFKNFFNTAKIYSFEASPLRIESLKENSQGFDLSVFNLAVSNKNEFVPFYESLVDNERVDAQGSFYKHTKNYKNRNPRIKQQTNSKMIPSIRISFCRSTA